MLTEPSLPSHASPIPATALPSLATPSHKTSPTARHLSAPSSKHLIASPYIPASRYISPRSFINLPPANPDRGADEYLREVLGPGDDTDEEDVTDVVEGVRENGDGIAVDRRKGLAEDDETGGEDVVTLVWRGGSDGAWIETGRPPGVRALAIEGPGVKVSRPVGVAVFLRLGRSRIGVGDLEVEYIESTDDPATWEVKDGSSVDDKVLSPEGVSRAAAFLSAYPNEKIRDGHTVSPNSLRTSPTTSPSNLPIQLSDPSAGTRTISGPKAFCLLSNAALAAALGSAFLGEDRADLTEGISSGTNIILLTSGKGDEAGNKVFIVSSNAWLVVRGLAWA